MDNGLSDDWVVAYQEAFKAANPHYDQPIRVRHWTGGWYQIAFPEQPYDGKKHTRKQIEAMTERLRAKVVKADKEVA
mgnify:CR=1 FL=1|jgi:hypothetical protein